jgi:hypothetical protein
MLKNLFKRHGFQILKQHALLSYGMSGARYGKLRVEIYRNIFPYASDILSIAFRRLCWHLCDVYFEVT